MSKKMKSPHKTIIFAVIADREVDFFLAIANRLKEEFQIHFISFYEPGVSSIEDAGFNVLNCYSRDFDDTNLPFSEVEWEEQKKKFDRYSLHERLTFGLAEDVDLTPKFERFIRRFHGFLGKIRREHTNIVVFQELGGFVAPMSLYFACCDLDIEHVFFEPSFFLRRQQFNTNTLNTNPWPKNLSISRVTQQSVEAYFESYIKTQVRIAPVKDTQHYKKSGLTKLVNMLNLCRLAGKLINKYVYGLKEEYSHIGNHVLRAIKAQITFARLKSSYVKCADLEAEVIKYLFFPLHVSLDYQLTTRSPEFLNQIEVIEQITVQLKPGWKLILKEHPATVGTLSYSRLSKLLSRPDVILLDPQESVHNIIPKCEAVVTINSKVGAEALVFGKTVYCLGQSFYRDFAGVVGLDDVAELKDALAQTSITLPQSTTVRKDFEKLWQVTYPGELYDMAPSNVEEFTSSIRRYLNHPSSS